MFHRIFSQMPASKSRRICRFVAFLVFLLCASGVASAASKLTVAPAAATVPLGGTLQLKAEIDEVASTKILWKITPQAGVPSTGLGSVTSAGLYTAPSSLPPRQSLAIQATSQAYPNLRATVTIDVVNPKPTVTRSTPAPLPVGYSLLTITGTNFVSGATINFGGVPLVTDFISSTQLAAIVHAPSSGTYVASVTNPAPGGGTSRGLALATGSANLPSYSGAVRFLEQCTFGPTPALIAQVQQLGYEQFLGQQFQLHSSVWLRYPDGDQNASVPPQFYSNALNNSDQVRQRVALALSEIFVTSGVQLTDPDAVQQWQNLLLNDAFANYSKLLGDVTLSPSMGNYLDMVNNAKADPVAGTSPDENYAREVMQLFSIGLYKLHQDGSLALDSTGAPIPTYNQDVIEGFSAAFTGWTYAPANPRESWWGNPPNYASPMVPMEAYHDTNPKLLLDNVTSPAGQSAPQDLIAALASISNHPNVAPFFSKQLIQHLVTSNPSPAYIARVAAVFENNGKYVRGDLASVVQAILLDPEARAGDDNPAIATGGHLREPALFMTGTLRALRGIGSPKDSTIEQWGAEMGQDITNSPDVFNYFPIGYQVPATGQTAPEMGIFNPATAIVRANWVANLVFGSGKVGQAASYSLADWTSIAKEDLLVDKLDLFFLHGQMSAGLRAAVFHAMNVYPPQQSLQRVQQALYVVLTSPEYQVEQ
jgi:hypothetical protein